MPAQPVHMKIQAARQLAARTWPYLATAVFRLVPRECAGMEMPTLAVDKYWRLYYDRGFVESMPVGTLALALAGHELWHLLGRHHARGTGHPTPVRQWCSDFAINSAVRAFAQAGRDYRERQNQVKVAIEADEAWLYPEKAPPEVGGPFPAGLVYEEYLELFKIPPAPGDAAGGRAPCDCGSGAHGQRMPYEDPPPGAGGGDGEGGAAGPESVPGVSEAAARVIARGVAEAIKTHAAKYPGTVPAGFLTWAEYELTPPQIPWERKLRVAVRRAVRWASGRVERTYSRRSSRQPCRARREGRKRFLLPGLHAPRPDFVAVLDTSGSMGHDNYQKAFSELAGMARLQGHAGVPVMCCDAGASEVRIVKRFDRVLLEGGGGTDMGAGVLAAVAAGYQVIVVLTDGYTPWPAEPPPVAKVVVALVGPEAAGFPVPDWAEKVVCVDEPAPA